MNVFNPSSKNTSTAVFLQTTLHQMGFPWEHGVRGQRQSRDKLSAERRGRLDELGFVWDPLEADWAEGFRYLKMYKEREGHCRVPTATRKMAFASVSGWVVKRRQNKQTLSEARRQQLDELGFVWDPLETDWAEGLRYLTIYKEREGHCRVPDTHKENGFRLGQWVSAQRTYNEARTPYLHHADNNWMSLDLFGTHSKRTGRKASAI